MRSGQAVTERPEVQCLNPRCKKILLQTQALHQCDNVTGRCPHAICLETSVNDQAETLVNHYSNDKELIPSEVLGTIIHFQIPQEDVAVHVLWSADADHRLDGVKQAAHPGCARSNCRYLFLPVLSGKTVSNVTLECTRSGKVTFRSDGTLIRDHHVMPSGTVLKNADILRFDHVQVSYFSSVRAEERHFYSYLGAAPDVQLLRRMGAVGRLIMQDPKHWREQMLHANLLFPCPEGPAYSSNLPSVGRYEAIHRIAAYLCSTGALDARALPTDMNDPQNDVVLYWAAHMCEAVARTFAGDHVEKKCGNSDMRTSVECMVQWLACDSFFDAQYRHRFFSFFEQNIESIESVQADITVASLTNLHALGSVASSLDSTSTTRVWDLAKMYQRAGVYIEYTNHFWWLCLEPWYLQAGEVFLGGLPMTEHRLILQNFDIMQFGKRQGNCIKLEFLLQGDSWRPFRHTHEVAQQIPVIFEAGEKIRGIEKTQGPEKALAPFQAMASGSTEAHLMLLSWAVVSAPGNCGNGKDMYTHDVEYEAQIDVDVWLEERKFQELQDGNGAKYIQFFTSVVHPLVKSVKIHSQLEVGLVNLAQLRMIVNSHLANLPKEKRWDPEATLSQMAESLIKDKAQHKSPLCASKGEFLTKDKQFYSVMKADIDGVRKSFQTRRGVDISPALFLARQCTLRLSVGPAVEEIVNPELRGCVKCASLRDLFVDCSRELLCCDGSVKDGKIAGQGCKCGQTHATLPSPIVAFVRTNPQCSICRASTSASWRRCSKLHFLCQQCLGAATDICRVPTCGAPLALTSWSPPRGGVVTQVTKPKSQVNHPLYRSIWGSKNMMSHFANRDSPSNLQQWNDMMSRGVLWGVAGFCVETHAMMRVLAML